MKLKKDDNVIVISGKDVGKKGKITRAIPAESKVVVEGVNFKTRRIKPRKAGDKGQVVEIASPIDASNVLLFCEKCKKGSRTRVKDEKGKKTRVCVKCDKAI